MSDEDSLLEEEENEPSNDSLEEVKEANEGLEESGKSELIINIHAVTCKHSTNTGMISIICCTYCSRDTVFL